MGVATLEGRFCRSVRLEARTTIASLDREGYAAGGSEREGVAESRPGGFCTQDHRFLLALNGASVMNESDGLVRRAKQLRCRRWARVCSSFSMKIEKSPCWWILVGGRGEQ